MAYKIFINDLIAESAGPKNCPSYVRRLVLVNIPDILILILPIIKILSQFKEQIIEKNMVHWSSW